MIKKLMPICLIRFLQFLQDISQPAWSPLTSCEISKLYMYMYWWLIHTERKKLSTNNFKTIISNVEPFFCSRIKKKRPKQARDQPAWMAPPGPPQCWKVTIGHVTTSVILTKMTERYMTQHHIDIWFQLTANTMSIVRKLSEAFRYSIQKSKGQTL